MKDSKLDLSSPWAIHVRKLMALFEHDREVEVVYDARDYYVKIYVDNPVKAEALSCLVPSEVTFGNVTLEVAVISPNGVSSIDQTVRQAFDGNPAFSGVEVEHLPDGSPVTFALFEPECAQLFADDLANPWGLQTMTYEDLAREVLDFGEVRVTSGLIAG